nr:protease Lon-related BREX system protein BrxL [uncultured Butyrivibrio sp.]
MTELDKKVIDIFPGKVVRKDLTSLMKKGSNIPTYVLEYLLGMYCATDDDEAIEAGISRIRKIISENYVSPDQSEYIKSRIKEEGQYTVIDKVSVELDEREDKYIARFTNLNIDPFEVQSELVISNEKLLIGGIWSIVKLEYVGSVDDEWGQRRKTKYSSLFKISSLKPIQMPNLDLDEIIGSRERFTTDEWVALLLRSAGYEPTEMNRKQRMHYLLRMVPFIQKNYNLVELGPRGTGKSHVYSELSPYSILMSSGHTTVSNMFYNMASKKIGLVGNWDCVAFDEVAGITHSSADMVQILKNYMANGSFARGNEAISADASIAFEGNTFRSVADMMRTTNLFEPFPTEFNMDSAFFDRIHAYLPGWETPKLKSALITKHFGLISDCLAEFCHAMRKIDFTDLFAEYYSLNNSFNTRDEIAVRRTFSGLAKLIFPNGQITQEETKYLLEYSIECRRRVKEQLSKMNPSEFSDISLGYIDELLNVEMIVELPEVAEGTLISSAEEKAGYVYSIGRSVDDVIGVYRLENKVMPGTGKLSFNNVEGLTRGSKSVKDSITAAFNYFGENAKVISGYSYSKYDYSMYFNDMQNRNVSDEVSVAEVVGLVSALMDKPVRNSLVIIGRVVMSGSMMPVTSDLNEIIIHATNAGAKTLLVPEECKDNYARLAEIVKKKISVEFYETPIDAARKALDI